MKIDLLHKPTEYMETVIILQEENGDIEKLEYLLNTFRMLSK
jgi:hypothetical protein